MEPFNEQYRQPETHEHTQEQGNECPICLEPITGTQWHCGEAVTCASGLHAFHRACAAGITNNQCPFRCGPMVAQQGHVANQGGGHGHGHGGNADDAYAAPVVNNAAAVQHHGVYVVPTGTDASQAVVQGATVDVQGFDYHVHGGAGNTAAANTEYDILLANGTLLVQGVTVQADAGGGTYTFGFVWEDVAL